jgi:uncharacterized protein (TIGR00251 family)
VSPYLKDAGGGVELLVLVQPRASVSRIVGLHDGRLKIALAAPPVDGEANAALIALLCGVLKVRRADVTLVDGQAGRRKRVLIAGATAAEIDGALLREAK